jgi:hypothetical protein
VILDPASNLRSNLQKALILPAGRNESKGKNETVIPNLGFFQSQVSRTSARFKIRSQDFMQDVNRQCNRLQSAIGVIYALFKDFSTFPANPVLCNVLEICITAHAFFSPGVIFASPFNVLNRVGTGSIAKVIKGS